MLAEERGRLADLAGRAPDFPGDAVEHHLAEGVVDLDPTSAGGVVGVVECLGVAEHRQGGDAGALQRHRRLMGVTVPGPLPDAGVEGVLVAEAAVHVGETRLAGPRGLA